MTEISNKKRKFIKRTFKQLSIEELAQKTGLKPNVIRSLIEEYSAEMSGKDKYSSKKLINDKDSLKKRSVYVGVIVIFLLTLIVYTPILKNGFVWDDIDYVSENTLIRSLRIQSLYGMLTSFHAGNWHPLTWLSHAIDYAIWGLNPLGHHLTNIILHGLNILLVFFLTIKLIVKAKEVNGTSSPSKMPLLISTQALIVSGVTALLFGLHPLHVESVAWIAERKDLLCTFFVLLCISSYLSYSSSVVKRHRWIWFNTCLLLFIFALMSKPMAVTLPVILLLLDIYPLNRISLYLSKTGKKLSVFLEKIPFFALSIASSIITIIAQHSGGAIKSLEHFHIDTRLLNAVRSLIFYLEKIIAPVKLVPFYPFPTDIHWLDLPYLLSTLLVLVITGLCLWKVKQEKYLFFSAWLYYVVTLLPVLGIIQVGTQAAADRYTYLPSLSIFLLIGVGVSWIFERGALIKHKGIFGGLILAFIFIFLGQLTIKQIKIWHNSEILWSYVIKVFPFPRSDPLAHNNLGTAYNKKGELDKAISEYKRALFLRPRYADAHNNLGAAYVKKGELDKAISECKKAITINPNYAEAHNNLGTTYLKKDELDKAISEYRQAIVIKPDYAKAHNNLTVAYCLKENYRLAIIHCNKALELGHNVNPKLLELLKPYR
jgi:tetratricopeptide (TPR) repeat protein